MSSGPAHARASLVLTATGVPVAIWTCDPLAGLAVAAGCVTGIVLSPDLDLEGRTESENVVWRLGCVPGFLFQWYFYGYALAARHRQAWTHFPIFSTVIRIVVAFWPLPVLYLVLRSWFAIHWRPGPLFWWYFGWWFFGLCESDTAHWVMDLIASKFKRKKRKKR